MYTNKTNSAGQKAVGTAYLFFFFFFFFSVHPSFIFFFYSYHSILSHFSSPWEKFPSLMTHGRPENRHKHKHTQHWHAYTHKHTLCKLHIFSSHKVTCITAVCGNTLRTAHANGSCTFLVLLYIYCIHKQYIRVCVSCEGGRWAVLGFCCAYCALSQINNSLHVYLTKGTGEQWKLIPAIVPSVSLPIKLEGRAAPEGRPISVKEQDTEESNG